MGSCLFDGNMCPVFTLIVSVCLIKLFLHNVCVYPDPEQTQGYRISLALTKPVQSGFVGTMKLIINFLCQLGLDPELMKRVHVNV